MKGIKKESGRFAALGAYPFAAIDRKVTELKEAGIDVLDFGVGDPTYPTPEFIRAAAVRGIEKHSSSGYPSYYGSAAFRTAVASWMKARFGVELDPAKELCSSIGSKEAVFHLHEALVEPGDIVLMPSPGYPPYRTGTLFAEGTPVPYPLLPENGFLPDLAAIPEDVARRARIIWVNYPNSPTGRCASLDELRAIYDWAAARNIIVASDEAYTELWYEQPPVSMLQVAREGVLVFQSLSKRSAMTGYRIGWVCGDPALVATFKRLKTNIDSGVPDFVQEAAIAALADERHVEEARSAYLQKRDHLLSCFSAIGLHRPEVQGAIYMWQQAPRGLDSVDYANLLLDPAIAIAVVPGAWISVDCNGVNPGRNMVRWSLTATQESVTKAIDRLTRHLPGLLEKSGR